ncbi:hypothetical protein OH76DRAFT_1552658 [Lentinus brumalis]|uniref:Uncharacterized protein n=1 Tax=Lentinus brumalis TaxID=2498619 RepID=A0A371DQ27_9APHY|nr:hypothetical protein OH76DRAFT_1552658 [Polyporus brumalis]
MPSTPPVPTPGPSVLVVSALVVALCILCLGPAAVILIHRLRRYSIRKSDVKACVKDHRSVRLPPASTGYGIIPDDLQVPARVKIAASSPLRDSLLGTAIGQLSWPEAGKAKAKRIPLAPIQEEVVDIEATAGLPRLPDIAVAIEADPETAMSFPEWVRPHLAEFREQAQKKWDVYIPGTGLVAAASSLQTAAAIPDIVVHSPTEPQLHPAFSAGSVYSQDSWDDDHSRALYVPPSPGTSTPELDASSVASSPDIDSPDLETPKHEYQLPLQLEASRAPAVRNADMSSEASFYWPLLPSFLATAHLQVSPSTWNSPVREEVEATTSSWPSGQPFVLCSRASASTTTQSRRSTTVFGASSRSATVGLGLKSGTSGSFSTSSSLREALDLWAQALKTCEPPGKRVASDFHGHGRLAYRTTRGHPVHGYRYL